MIDGALTLKLMMPGKSGVGKTSLLVRWTTGVFDARTWPRVGPSHIRKTVNVDGEQLHLSLRDTDGAEMYHALTSLYAGGSSVAVIVIDIRERADFNSSRTWINLLQTACPGVPPIVLAVNKIDLVDSRETFPSLTSKFFGQFDIFFVSAKTGENVSELFQAAVIHAIRFQRAADPTFPVQAIERRAEAEKPCC
jgi:small GTP-binding protein